MAIKRFDVVAVTGTYTDRDGNEKRRFLNCGAVFENDKGLSLKLESLPLGSDGWFYLFEPRGEQSTPHQQRSSQSEDLVLDEAPPF